MGRIVKRAFLPPDLRKQSIFLWGPRRTGKSHWIAHELRPQHSVDLLKSDVLAEYTSRPQLLRERFGAANVESPIVIDEIQKAPALLDEVHWLIENAHKRFVLTGSSARKLRRGHANLLAGRAWRRELRPLCFAETGPFDVEPRMVSGFLPPHFLSEEPREDLRTYVADYLKEEIIAEGVVQNLPAFSEFLRVAALTSAEILNYTNVGRECGVSAKVVRRYFEILEDTLLGFRIPPWRGSKTRRLIETEKFYLFDVGVANFLARRTPRSGVPEFGKAFEQYILMELMAFKAYRQPDLEITFWRTVHGHEVDFILNDREAAIEIKASERVHEGHLKGLGALPTDAPVGRRYVVCFEREPRTVTDSHGEIAVLPWQDFLERLWSDELTRR